MSGSSFNVDGIGGLPLGQGISNGWRDIKKRYGIIQFMVQTTDFTLELHVLHE